MNEAPRQEIKPDICIIGAGAGGLTAAAAAAAFGVNVVLVEGRGAGHRTGALPAKALQAAAERAGFARNGARYGVSALRPGMDFAAARRQFAAARAHVQDVLAAVAPQQSHERFNGLGVRIVEGEGRFTDRATVAVNGFDIRARRFVIATGSSPALPAIPGLADLPYFTEDTIFDLPDCPRHLIVIGASAAGLELAQAFRRLGAEVTVLDAAAPLPDDDVECAGIVRDALTREGVVIRSGVEIARVRRALAKVQVEIVGADGPQTIEGSHLLIAAGRQPNVDRLDLEAAGIRYGIDGIDVDPRLRTSNKQVYAIGDVTGAPHFTHLAQHHAALVVRHALFRTPVRADRLAVPRVIYTDPELAQVGLSEDEARTTAGDIRVLRSPYRENDRALATGAVAGHIKVVTDRHGGILGVTLVGAGAAENIAAWTLAIEQKLNIGAVAGVIMPYPTYAEVGKRAAMTYFTRGLTAPLTRRIIGWLRRFG
jgi:pyruvate/2-oxoglutarate dehydrogenase complex dihydrolipoamide dehydrogenase (E3) component